MKNQIVILAAGQGKRMGGNIPKVLVMFRNKPLILHLLEEVEKVPQLAKTVIVVGYKYQDVRGVLGEEYLYAYQSQQLGTAHALLCAKEKVIAENILVLYGDMPFIKSESLKKIISLHLKNESKVSLLTAKVENFENAFFSLKSYGRIVRGAGNKILKIVEVKDTNEVEKKITEVNPGIYMFNTKWLWENISKVENKNFQKEFYLTDLVEVAIKHGTDIKNYEIDAKEILGVNSPEDLEIANRI